MNALAIVGLKPLVETRRGSIAKRRKPRCRASGNRPSATAIQNQPHSHKERVMTDHELENEFRRIQQEDEDLAQLRREMEQLKARVDAQAVAAVRKAPA